MESKSKFETKIAPLLTYIGTIGACITAVAYIITVFILIYGFKAQAILQTTIFSVITAAIGVLIMQLLKYQGVTFAREKPENKELERLYYNTKTKDKKLHNMTYFWITTGVKDVLVKAVILSVSTIGIIYIVIEGSKDYKLILLAFENLLLWVCFGMLSMKKAFDFYENSNVPYMKAKLEEVQVASVKVELKAEESVEPKENETCSNMEMKSSETFKSK